VEKNNLIIDIKDVCFSYTGGSPVLDKLNFKLQSGDRFGLMGPNGSGKTTLFHIIMGLLKPTSGRIEIYNRPAITEKDFREVRRNIGLLFQDADDQLFSPTVLEDVAFGPLNLGKSREEAIEIALNTLNFLGLSGFEDRITYKLSGGEKKLVSLATVLSMQPEVLLLDEPTSGLDEKTQESLKGVLTNLDLSYLIISHDIDFLSETTDAIYAMVNGRIHFDQELHVHQHVHAHPHGIYTHEHD
jgi:cobalt/nickel transport system ATP-binding protein